MVAAISAKEANDAYLLDTTVSDALCAQWSNTTGIVAVANTRVQAAVMATMSLMDNMILFATIVAWG